MPCRLRLAIVAGMRAGKLVFVYRAAIVAVAAFVAALAGFGLQGLLPAAYVADAKSTVTSVIGLTGLLFPCCSAS